MSHNMKLPQHMLSMKQPSVKHEILIVTEEQKANYSGILVGVEESTSIGVGWNWILRSVSYRVELQDL